MSLSFSQPEIRLRRWSVNRLALNLLLGVAVWAIVGAGCVCVGSTGQIGWPASSAIRDIRVEIVLLSSLIGAALGAAGVVYQAILRNPLADPYLLGVSSGASLCAYAWRFPLVWWSLGESFFAAISQQAFAFGGALTVVAIVLVLATRRGRLQPVTLLLVGVIVNSINGALFLLLDALKPQITQGIGGPMSFLIGGIQTNLTRGQEYAAAIVIMAAGIVPFYLAGQLNVATLNEAEAEALGVRIQRLRWTALIAASVITAAAVSISGPIGFVGLICPHMARKIVGADHRRLLPWATAFGAALLCVADAVSRLLVAQKLAGTRLPVGVLTALLGGPFFLLLLRENKSMRPE
ncbi:MAG TPA: iron ABC transporter permease [Tepidisphaeraceae bacterium]|jgi:iron complex transport system permease protein|nr:iron ABC transporter permease [Tepidisphaeraceae bacterium]